MLVVVLNLALDIEVLKAGVSGKNVEGVGRVGEVGADIVGHREAVVEAGHLIGCLGGAVEIELRGLFDVGHHMGRLIRGNVGIHVTELALDYGQTVLDEFGCGNGNLVLVADPVFIVHVDKSLEEILGALGAYVVVR